MADYWEKTKVLGSGSNATVYLAHISSNPGTGGPVMAVKSTENLEKMESLKWELSILDHLAGTPNIVWCYGHNISLDTDKGTYNLLLEFAPKGTLNDLITRSRHLKETQITCYAGMILKGLAGIHSKGIIHCDLKSADILVFPGPSEEIRQLNIADFGLARVASEKGWRNMFWEGSTRQYFNRRTAMYSLQESAEWGRHDTCADIWHLDALCKMITGKRIWKWNGDMEDLYNQIIHGSYSVPRGLSEAGVHFLARCLDRDPITKWLTEELLDHAFITNNLRIFSEVGGVDLNQNVVQEGHQGAPAGSYRHLFSRWVMEVVALMEQERQGAP